MQQVLSLRYRIEVQLLVVHDYEDPT